MLTGRPGCGKTTVIRRVLEAIGASGGVGFYTEEVRELGRRIGFDVVLLDGRRGPLARVGGKGPRVGRYGVDVESFERLAVEHLDRALQGDPVILLIDEIGKMELHSRRFVQLLGRVFDPEAAWAVLGTVMLQPHRLIAPICRRADIEVIEVTPANRDALPDQLAELFVR